MANKKDAGEPWVSSMHFPARWDRLCAGTAGRPDACAQAPFPGSFSEILAATGFGNLSGLVQKLSAGGLDAQVASWLGAGANLPVAADQLRAALGNGQVQQIAQRLGIPTDQILLILSQHLPAAVDQASLNGKIEEPEETRH